jgi:signal transduction histidine kinase
LWIVKESILGNVSWRNGAWLLRNTGWFAVPLFLACVPFSEAFIPSYSTDEDRIRGFAYYGYYVGLIGTYAWLFRESVLNVRQLTGARRLELQLWMYGGCSVAAAIYLLIGLGAVTQSPVFHVNQPLVIVVFYIITVYTITSHRVFDARQILLVIVEKSLLFGTALAVAAVTFRIAGFFLTDALSFILGVTTALVCAALLNPWLDRRFQFYPRGFTARQTAFAVAQRERRLEELETAFFNLLKGWGQTDEVLIVHGAGELRSRDGVVLASNDVVLTAMADLRWATPERLARERPTPGRTAVAQFLANHNLGLLVVEKGSTLTVLIGVGISASRRPFTYPQVSQLVELASIITGAFERALLLLKVQHAEQLATVGMLGASLAHEIRNPLVSIKTFVQLLPSHYQDPAFREKFFKLLGDEVDRIDHLTVQLLELATPRNYAATFIELNPVLRATIDLVATKAVHRNISLVTDLTASPDLVHTDTAAAKQVVLNLCFNAIQAVENQEQGERWVRVVTRRHGTSVEVAVSDSGPGIAPEMLPRLFQPFQTTKSSGFGLGLAICRDILAKLNASISVDPPQPNQGATFRVNFPCQPSLS